MHTAPKILKKWDLGTTLASTLNLIALEFYGLT
jgi:hypothetical protein